MSYTRFASLALLVACDRGSSPEPPEPVKTPIVAAGDAKPSAAAAALFVATCGPPWRSVITNLRALTVDDSGATLCADDSGGYSPGKPAPLRCARLDFAAGTFAEVARPATPVIGASVDRHSVCHAKSCVPLDISADDAHALDESYAAIELDSTGGKAVAPLHRANVAGVFDGATGHLLDSLRVPDGCVDDAFWLDDVVYVATARCDDAADLPDHAFLFAGHDRKPVKPSIHRGPPPVARLGDGVWAIGSENPYRVDVIALATRTVTLSVPLPELDVQPDDRLALGLTRFQTVVVATSPIAVTPSGRVVAVSSVGVALLDPVKRTHRVWRFPRC